jgi:hypothetical protein
MGRDAFTKEGVVCSLTGSIEKLRGQKHMARRVFFLKAADCGDADDPAHVQRPECVNVCAMIQLMGKQTMSAPMPGKEVNLPAMHLPADEAV